MPPSPRSPSTDEDPSFDDTPERDTAVPPYDLESFAREEHRKASGQWRAAPPVERLDGVPRLKKSLEQIHDVIADSKTAFVIGFIDGNLSLEHIVDVTGLPKKETLGIVARLIELDVVEMTSAR